MAAAVSTRERAKEEEILRREASHNHKITKERAIETFEELAKDGEWLLDSQIHAFLEQVMRREEGSLHPDGVQLVVHTARRMQEKEGLTPPPNKKGALAKKPLVNSVEKYGEYIKNVKKIADVFQKYDRHRTGCLNRKELTRMLQDYEMNCLRGKYGIDIKLMVTEEDIDWIIKECDADGNGQISHAEYLPAVAAWDQLAQMKLEHNDKCIIS